MYIKNALIPSTTPYKTRQDQNKQLHDFEFINCYSVGMFYFSIVLSIIVDGKNKLWIGCDGESNKAMSNTD